MSDKMKIIVGLLFIAALFAMAIWSDWSRADNVAGQSGEPVSGVVINRATINQSATITTGNTFQQVLATNYNTTTQRQALTIVNNNTSDNCWIFLGSGTATKATSILLLPGGSYTRYWPFVPSDAIQATCASNSDTLYVDTQ